MIRISDTTPVSLIFTVKTLNSTIVLNSINISTLNDPNCIRLFVITVDLEFHFTRVINLFYSSIFREFEILMLR